MVNKGNKKEENSPLIKELIGLRSDNLKNADQLPLPEKENLDFELLLSGLSAKFSSLSPSEIDNEIENGLRLIVEFLNLDRSTFFECDLENEQFSARHSYAVKGVARITTGFGANLFPYTWESLQKGEAIIFSNYSDLPEEAKTDITNFKKVELKSGYIVPIIIDAKVRFALAGGIAAHENHLWPEDLLSRIQLVGEIFGQTKNRSEQVHKLNEIITYNQKLISELDRFIPILDSKIYENCVSQQPGVSNLKKKNWLKTGVEYFAEYGRVDLNRICKRIGLAKTSFYNKYPNLENNKGLERYRKEVLDSIHVQLSGFLSKATSIVKREDAEQAKIEIIDLALADCRYFQCLGQIVIKKNDPYISIIGEKLHAELEDLVSLWLSKISESQGLSIIEQNGLQSMIINSIYHHSLVLTPEQWKQKMGSVLDQIISIIK